eukprot:CAMPEP_0203672828 /NCGR_PEP_ID=MMETSP0090-20130426/9571_1 /ASSEMBLY_ACC=CAM_ASM_001088 /TAXON_ID=426623 /ORGANISM="Chaetoceros affinis, Strain CCMP159" /LENGTH=462 /DNA_ID=CAMNT_0050538255 /DNA_START=158 /DNA_END=1545 /DNA_ORIENTATION=-
MTMSFISSISSISSIQQHAKNRVATIGVTSVAAFMNPSITFHNSILNVNSKKCCSFKLLSPLHSTSEKISPPPPATNDDDDDDNNNNNNRHTITPKSSSSPLSPSSKTSKKHPPKPQPPLSPSSFPSWSYQPRDFFRYELLYQSKISNARVGRIHTPHGIIDTPGYVAVATNGALKGLDMRDADDAGQQLVFCNSYHLLLQPGPEVIEGAGGLHKFINRNRPLITDSGGFQVFSLAYGSVQESLDSEGELKRSKNNSSAKKVRSSENQNTISSDGGSPVKVTEDGVYFKSYRDGRKIFLTPESTVEAQKAYGADIIIPLDQLPPYFIDRQKLVESVDRSHRWEARSLKKHLENVKNQAMYCVVHGGVDVELRTKSVEYLSSLPFDGYAIGGSLGKNSDELIKLLTWMMPMFEEGHRKEKPRHLLGIADEKSILESVKHGIDTFDSLLSNQAIEAWDSLDAIG